MTRITWKYFALLAMLAVSGCATKNADQDLDPSKLSETGLVFASLSTGPEGGNRPIATFGFNRGGFVNSREEQISGPQLKPSEFEDDFGRLIALELPAGPNSLTYWSLTYGVTQYSPAKSVPEITFTVEPGKVLYLGNLHVNVEIVEDERNQRVISRLLPEIRDRRERDVALFKSRYPLVVDADILLTQPFLGEWSQGIPLLSQ